MGADSGTATPMDWGYVRQHARRSTFEMATSVAGKDTYEPKACWIVGPIAVHRNDSSKWPWKMSHAATGLAVPYAYGRNLREAVMVARALGAATDWSGVKRTTRVGVVNGLTRDRQLDVQAMIQSFSFLSPPPRRSPTSASRHG